MHVANTDLCPHELRSLSIKKNCLDLRTSRLWARWPHILDGLARNKMDNNLHACSREANSVTMPKLKWRPKKGLRSHLRASNFQKIFLEEHAPLPPSLILCIRVVSTWSADKFYSLFTVKHVVAAPPLKVFQQPWILLKWHPITECFTNSLRL